ncbi:MAG: hypothetical protein HDS29_06260 [Bacteroides sp.]|nr:hypothetical protein [Bacteroides sp.]
MKKSASKIYLILIAAFAQSIVASAQKEALTADSIASLILNRYAEAPQEKIYVHTDRSHYAAGDTVWFRAYVADAATNLLSDRSKFVYIELLDNAADTLIKRIKIKADDDGVFANAIPLSSRMKTGSYTLAAYTRWMQNFDEEMFFKKRLKVVNPADSVSPQPEPREINEMVLDVMPEGGNLIARLPQRVAYKAVGDDGLGVNVQVRLVNADGEVIREGASQHRGMGYILVNADADEELWLEAFSDDGLSCRTKLPKALTQGVALSVNQHKGTVLIQPRATPGFDISRVALALYGADNLLVKELTDESPVSISARDLKPGVINIALIDMVTRKTLAERLIFVRDADPAELDISSSAD